MSSSRSVIVLRISPICLLDSFFRRVNSSVASSSALFLSARGHEALRKQDHAETTKPPPDAQAAATQ